MKNYILVLAILFNCTVFGQSNFSNGFSDGYKKGYCHNQGNGCMSPLPPITPIPKIGENTNSYQDGYNRGFEEGLNSQKSSSSNTTRDRFKAQNVELSKNNIYQPDNKLIQQNTQIMDKLIVSAIKNLYDKNYDEAVQDAEKLTRIGGPKEVEYCVKCSVYTERNENPIEAYNYGIYSEPFCLSEKPKLKARIVENMQVYLLNFMIAEDYRNLEIACSNVWYETNYTNMMKGFSRYYQNDYKEAKKYFEKCGDNEMANKYLESIENKTILPNPFLN